MNKFNRAAINYFGEKTNREYLKSKLITYFSSGKYVGYPGTSKICASYINKTLDTHLHSFVQQVERDFLYTPLVTERYPSDQNPGDQVACLNMKFTEHMIDLVEGDLLNWERRQEYAGNASYTLNDGLNASSKTIVGHAPRSVLRDKDTRIVDDPMFHYHTKSDIWGGVVGGGENTKNNAIKTASVPNNVLFAEGQPSEFNSSKWIEMFGSKPCTLPQNLASTSSWQSSAVQLPDRSSRVDDVNKKTCEIKGFKFARANKLQPLSSETKSADAEVNKWWYPVSAVACIRDDPVGELNRDRGVESGGITQRNQVEFPYGNASGWRGSSLVQNSTHSTRESNQNESRRFMQHPVHPAGTQPLYSAVPSAKGFVFDTSDCGSEDSSLRSYHRNVVSEGFNNKPNKNAVCEGFSSGAKTTQNNIELSNSQQKRQGNSLCSYSPTNVEISSGHSFSGVIDPTNLGDENNRFTGESPEFAGNHLDRLLGTPYIQTLNTQYGDAPRQQAVSSCYDRGKYGAKMLAGKPDSEFSGSRPQNSVMFWQIGDGFVDQKNDPLMERLQTRRIFRSFNRGCDFKEGESSGNTNAKKVTMTNPHGNSASDQIPWFERALYNRYYERDVEESVGGFELDNLSRGYGKDMMSLYCRVQKKNLNPMSCGKTDPPYPKGNREIPLPSGYNQVTYENSNKTYPPWAFYSPK